MSFKTKALAEKLSRIVCTDPVCVPDSGTVAQALAAMREKESPVAMICKGRRLVGIFTERDYLMRVLGKANPEDPIKDFMTQDPINATLGQTLGEAIEIMDGKGLRNLPVLDDAGSPVSFVSATSIVGYLADHFPASVMNLPPDPHQVCEEMEGG